MASERTHVDPRTGEITENVAIRPFRDILSELGEGATESELAEAMWDLVQRVQDTGKAGSLTLTIRVEANGQGRVEVKDEVKLRLPEFARPTTAFFIAKAGNLSRRNPQQPEIPGVTHIETKKEA